LAAVKNLGHVLKCTIQQASVGELTARYYAL